MKIALVGAHRATKLLAPYSDAAWAVWSCSPFNESELPRVDAWFEMHIPDDPGSYLSGAKDGGVYRSWLATLPLVYMQDRVGDIPGSQRYPLEVVLANFGPYFLTGTIGYMAALAILAAPDEIGLWGIGACPEYAHQKAGLRYFVQRARDRCIAVTGPDDLLEPEPLYGYECPPSTICSPA